jgi:hypothetical protein
MHISVVRRLNRGALQFPYGFGRIACLQQHDPIHDAGLHRVLVLPRHPAAVFQRLHRIAERRLDAAKQQRCRAVAGIVFERRAEQSRGLPKVGR